jgi:hypothetical protein
MTREKEEKLWPAALAQARSGMDEMNMTTREKLKSAGANADKYESLVQSLPEELLLSLFASEAEHRKSGTELATSVFEAVAGLTEEQITGLTEMKTILLRFESKSHSTVW